MSHEKSFSEIIDNTISKRQIVIHQRAFIYDKLLFSFPFWPSEKFKINGTDSSFYVLSNKSNQHFGKE